LASQKIRQKWPKLKARKPDDYFSRNIRVYKLKNVWEGKEKGKEEKERRTKEGNVIFPL
jgi:hypothetical protein